MYEFFIYSTSQVSLSSAETESAPITIQADSSFECHYITATVLQSNVIVGNWGGTVQVHESAVGKNWFNTPICLDAIAGDGRDPFVLPAPKLIRANNVVTVTFVNNVATTTVVQLHLVGNKVFQ
jgi:hypothetical protein